MKRHSVVFAIGLTLASGAASAFSGTAVEDLRLMQQCSAQPPAADLIEVDTALLRACIELVRRWAERSAIASQ